jgi:hypothetical protein
MHFNFGFTAVQILWTLTFAALLVLLVVLLGRDRARRYPWFTTSIALIVVRLLASRLLYGRLPQLTLAEIFIVLANVAALVGLLVLVEVARRAFRGVQRHTWIGWTLMLLAAAAYVLSAWGPWPDRRTLTADSTLAVLRLMQLAAQKGDLLVSLLTVGLGLLVVLFGRRFQAGWRSHTQQIAIGLSTAAMAQLAVQGTWLRIALRAAPKTEAEFERIMGLREKLFNANGAVYLAVLVWWIVWLWMDEPGTAVAAEIPSAPAAEEAAAKPKDDPEDELKGYIL